MKIFRNNILYVQKRDLNYLLIFNIDMPPILKENLKRIDLTDNNKNDFIRFRTKEEINYYNSLPWLIDYDEYSETDEIELLEIGNVIGQKLKTITNKDNYNNKEKLKEYKILALKLQTLRDFFWYKRGFINTQIPLECLSRNK